MPIFFIIFCISPNCFTSRLTSATVVPEPAAIRARRVPWMIAGKVRSSIVIDVMIASIGFRSLSSILAFFSSFGIPGIMLINPPSEPIFLSACICSRKSSRVNCPSINFVAAASA